MSYISNKSDDDYLVIEDSEFESIPQAGYLTEKFIKPKTMNGPGIYSTKSVVEHKTSYSPLRRFGNCKQDVMQAFSSLKEVIEETETFLSNLEKSGESDRDFMKDLKQVAQFRVVINAIDTALKRDIMKVVFVGHTSNGKSTVINSMLSQNVLPTGIGHTTCSFCCVQGTNEEPYMVVRDDEISKNEKTKLSSSSIERTPSNSSQGNVRCSITNVEQVASALSPGSTNPYSKRLVTVYWDKSKCKLLSEEVMLIDSPGLDLDGDYDKWIDDHCADADVFVLVANAESALKQSERAFFSKVSEKLSKPNIFMLYNRWDGSDMELRIEDVKRQHRERAIDFLTLELGIVKEEDIDDRVFFISAKEMLLHRTRPGYNGARATDSSTARYEQFKKFEQKFEQCISQAAIRTKFESHLTRGLDIAAILENMSGSVIGSAILSRTQCHSRLRDKQKQLSSLREKRDVVLTHCRTAISETQSAISSIFSHQFGMIVENDFFDMVKRFDYAVFNSDDESLQVFKTRLAEYVGKEFCELLTKRCLPMMNDCYKSCQDTMIEEVGTILDPSEQGGALLKNKPSGSPILQPLFTKGIIDDFNPKIEFRFSLGWRALAPRFFGQRTVNLLESVLPVEANEASEVSSELTQSRGMAERIIFSLLAPSSLLPVMTVAATLTTKPTVWKLGVSLVGMYGLLYAWEFLTYTTSSKERSFKQQFIQHVGSLYKEKSSTFSEGIGQYYVMIAESQILDLQYQIDEHNGQLQKEIGVLEGEERKLMKMVNEGESTNRHAKNVLNKLQEYYDGYIGTLSGDDEDEDPNRTV